MSKLFQKKKPKTNEMSELFKEDLMEAFRNKDIYQIQIMNGIWNEYLEHKQN